MPPRCRESEEHGGLNAASRLLAVRHDTLAAAVKGKTALRAEFALWTAFLALAMRLLLREWEEGPSSGVRG